MIERRYPDCPWCSKYHRIIDQRRRQPQWDYRKFRLFEHDGMKELSRGSVTVRLTKDMNSRCYGPMRRGTGVSAVIINWKGDVVAHANFGDDCISFEEGEYTPSTDSRHTYIHESMEA